jgi:DsbC/DsbD-like thiol-disulfide interchange protein
MSLMLLGWPALPARAEAAWSVASDWVKGTGSRIRLIGAELTDGAGGKARLVAGVEIELEDGWKTYWRSPGDSGGIPPTFDWDQSRNLAKAVLLYPGPKRFADAEGVSAGYKKHVVFPIEVTPDGEAPVRLVLGAFYGICREICVPAEAELSLELARGPVSDPAIAAALEEALAAVPRRLAEGALPALEAMTTTVTGDKTELVFDVRFDGAAEGSLFAEAEDGSYVPVPERVGPTAGGGVRFVARLKTQEAAALKGKRLVLTLVSDQGNAEVLQTLE